MRAVYADHHAMTPLRVSAMAAMDAARALSPGNPQSVHAKGRIARNLIETAREQVAQAIAAKAADLVFVSGGTEACNLGIHALARDVDTVITTRIEHPAVSAAIERLQLQNPTLQIAYLDVREGEASFESALPHLGPRTLLAAQWVNHETGTILPVNSWTKLAKEKGAKVFVDATQALGKLSVDVATLGADALAFASSKTGGPLGVGALWLERSIQVESMLVGGQQERGRRGGTQDPISLAGFGAAAQAMRLSAHDHNIAIDEVYRRLSLVIEEAGGVINATKGERTFSACNASVRGWTGQGLVMALDLEGVCASSGAACSSGTPGPSPVLLAMHPDQTWRASSALRLSFSTLGVADSELQYLEQTLRKVLARKGA